MNCEEFCSQISEGKYSVDTEAARHLELCAECRARAHADESLRQYLAAVRESAPVLPAALDVSVIAAYRAKVTKKTTASGGMRIFRPLVWSAVAASLIVAAVLMMTHRKHMALPNGSPAQTTSIKTLATESAKNLKQTPVNSPVNQPGKKRARPRVHRPRATEAPVTVAVRSTPSNGFQNLMFCDPLSCPGPMQVIRIQVPVTSINRVPAWRPTSGMVQADVVVGSDGIARAIRIVR